MDKFEPIMFPLGLYVCKRTIRSSDASLRRVGKDRVQQMRRDSKELSGATLGVDLNFLTIRIKKKIIRYITTRDWNIYFLRNFVISVRSVTTIVSHKTSTANWTSKRTILNCACPKLWYEKSCETEQRGFKRVTQSKLHCIIFCSFKIVGSQQIEKHFT